MARLVDKKTVLVQACLNGARMRAEHEGIPYLPEEIALEARRAVAAGAGAIHAHPRRDDGSETLDSDTCASVVNAIRAACPGVAVGLTTGLWIVHDAQERASLIASWTTLPDFCSINFSEDGATELCELLLSRRVGVEAGLATIADARLFVESGLTDRCLRVLVEVEEQDEASALATATAIDGLLERAGISNPRLHHGLNATTWAVLDAALARGHDIRVGLEDTLTLPDGRRARDNAELIGAAVALARRHGREAVSAAIR